MTPEKISAFTKIGMTCLQSGDVRQASQIFQQILQFDSKNAIANHYLGVIALQTGDVVCAELLIKRALKTDPAMVQAYNNLGAALKILGKLSEAKGVYQKLLEIDPNYAYGYANLGAIHLELGEPLEAIKQLRKAIQLDPGAVNAYNTLGAALRSVDQVFESISCYKKVLSLKPNFFEAYNNLGNALSDARNYQDAIGSFEKALSLKPDYFEARSNMLMVSNYTSTLSKEKVYSLHCEWDREFKRSLPAIASNTETKTVPPKQRLKIGYVSADYRNHPVFCFFSPLISNHNRSSFEVFCYYNNAKKDANTETIKSHAEHWRNIATLNDLDVVKLIQKDNIDILVDLSGHTAGNRLAVFAIKPAPIQITWLGYPNTTGLSNMDYRLTDEHADPSSLGDKYYTEKLIRLKHGFLCYQGEPRAQYSNELPLAKNGYITFGSFNNLRKITGEVLDVWAKIIASIPQSKLVIKSRQFESDQSRESVISFFLNKGIDASCITVLPPITNEVEHLQAYSSIDVGLDPFPYNGTTTTLEALWMGVPVITLLGDRHSGRVGTSIMRRINMEEFIVPDVDAYIGIAKDLANDAEKLKAIRESLRERLLSSDLCNAQLFTQEIEETYRSLWSNLSS